MGLLLLGSAASADWADPTQPPAHLHGQAPERASDTAPALRLTSIIHGSERRLARINDQWVREGDRVEGVEVLAIGTRTVRIRHGGHQVQLSLLGVEIQKRAVTDSHDQ
ncbi:hypothetical protein CAI21_13275 [Alkalilimnicola ehrlichii]|uniref:MSHA biogenesis protein MshK n=2 Tax=Alkalilimnicola ehrlichii TaxID=351052 RepID=A0A3E0WPK2_9GAMM|nr:hypothetical protein CAI21_13275 [Alkalilimnicola ehrlichii]RFA34882.1 hypothetical protein CAL65_14410 [Alkalilimnicola ehrlichii]